MKAPRILLGDSRSRVSAEVIWLCCRQPQSDVELAIDLRTAIDVAIRDLREIHACWNARKCCKASLRLHEPADLGFERRSPNKSKAGAKRATTVLGLLDTGPVTVSTAALSTA